MRSVFLKILILLFAFPVYSCSRNAANGNTVNITLPENILDTAETIKGDTVFRFTGPVMAAYFNDPDRIVAVTDRTGTLVKVLDINSGQVIDSLVAYGAEAGKFISGFPRIYRDTLIIYDMIKQQMALINPDSITADKDYCPEIRKLHIPNTFLTPVVIPYNDCFLGLNPYCFTSPDGAIDNHDERRFVLSDNTGTFPEPGTYRYMTANVAQGTVIAAPEKDRLIFCHKYDDLIEIYSWSSLKKLYKITGPADIRNTFTAFSEMVTVTRDNRKTYYSGTAGNEGFFTALNNEGSLYILQMDWDGNLLYCMRLGDTASYAISLSSDEKALYSLQTSPEGQSVMLRYDLN